jgi:O-acetylhomoserine (thiol)-lyase
MSQRDYHGFDTLSLHAGAAARQRHGARACRSTCPRASSSRFSDQAPACSTWNGRARLLAHQQPHGGGARGAHRGARGGVGAIATASGQAALHLAVATLAGAGSHIVEFARAVRRLAQPAALHAARFGIETTFVDPRDPTAGAPPAPDTKLLFGETLGNPGLDVLDIPTVAEIAHEARVPLLVDSTFTTPWLMKPFDHGADLVYHSATKFLCGHGTVVGGLLVDSGQLRLGAASAASFPSSPSPTPASTAWCSPRNPRSAPFLLRARREGLRDFGACMSPMNAFQILQGIETLSLRMARHVENARKRRAVPGRAPDGRSVSLSGSLAPEPRAGAAAAAARRGAVFSFDLKGDRAAGRRFVEALQVFSHLANVGDARSLVIHPASTTHFRMDAAALAAAGIGEGTLRLSVGLEDADDLIADLKRAFKAAEKA